MEFGLGTMLILTKVRWGFQKFVPVLWLLFLFCNHLIYEGFVLPNQTNKINKYPSMMNTMLFYFANFLKDFWLQLVGMVCLFFFPVSFLKSIKYHFFIQLKHVSCININDLKSKPPISKKLERFCACLLGQSQRHNTCAQHLKLLFLINIFQV